MLSQQTNFKHINTMLRSITNNQKMGFRVISYFMIDWLASKIVILFNKTHFFLFIVQHQFSKDFRIFKFGSSCHPGTKSVQQISEFQLPDPCFFVDFYLAIPILRCHTYSFFDKLTLSISQVLIS